MSFYKCGHDRKPVIMDANILSYSAYLVWKESTGFEGDRTQCWECFCKESNRKRLKGFNGKN